MVKFARIAVTAGLAALMVGPGAFAGGHGGDENPAVKARQSHMRLYAHNFGIIGNMARGNTEYDAADAQAAADNLVALTGMIQVGYWVEGTSVEEIEGTRMLPEAPSNLDELRSLTDGVNAAAQDVAAVAGDGLDAMRATLGPLGQACGACHEKYQQENQ